MSFRRLHEREQDGELLVTKDKKYSAKCFVGNWPGERLVQDVSLIGKLTFHDFRNLRVVSSADDAIKNCILLRLIFHKPRNECFFSPR